MAESTSCVECAARSVRTLIILLCIEGLLTYNSFLSAEQFSLFSMVQFENLPCQGVGSNDEATTGVCYTATECDEKQGNEIGKCASGFGVCCMVKTSTCGSTVSQNCSYIQNPTFPSTYAPTTAGACAFNVKPVGPSKPLRHSISLTV